MNKFAKQFRTCKQNNKFYVEKDDSITLNINKQFVEDKESHNKRGIPI